MRGQRLTFHITDRCQLNCDHCLRDPGAKAADLDYDVFTSVLDQARELYGSDHVGMTGGEPTLHPRFYEFVDALVDRGYTWHMVSNGERFDRVVQRLSARPERLASFAMANFSLDGASEETHDTLREKGSFRSVMQAISLCTLREIPFLLQMTINARNVDEIEAMALLASQLGATRIAFNFAHPSGTFLDASLKLPRQEWKRAMDRVNRVRATFKIDVLHSDTGPSLSPFFICEPWRHGNVHIDQHGQLTMCCEHSGVPSDAEISDVAGDLRNMTLAEAHGRLATLTHDAMQARLKFLAENKESSWDRDFACNWCLKHFGRPHWSEAGAVGVQAERPRWRGGWTPGYKDSHQRYALPLLPDNAAEPGAE